MRTPTSVAIVAALGTTLSAQCPYFSDGTISAGLARVGGGEDARLVYVDCIDSIGFVRAKFGTASGTSALDGLPLTIAIYDDPNDDSNPSDAVLLRQITVPGGVTGANTGVWQSYDIAQLSGSVVPATGGMWVAVGVAYPPAISPGPGSIEFGNNRAPGTQWLATSPTNGTINYGGIGNHPLVDIQTGPGFPPGTWVVTVESGAATRPYGSGCTGTNGIPAMVGDPQLPPVLNSVANLFLQNLPLASGAAAAVLGLAPTSPAPDLGTLAGAGATGCLLHVQPIDLVILVPVGGTAAYAFTVPNNPSLAGASLLTQGLALDGGANAMGVTSSNGLRVVIGH